MNLPLPWLQLGRHWTILPTCPAGPTAGEETVTTAAMTVQEVAAYLNGDPKTVYRLVNRRELPGFKVGGSWRFQKDDLDDRIVKQEEKAAGPPEGGDG